LRYAELAIRPFVHINSNFLEEAGFESLPMHFRCFYLSPNLTERHQDVRAVLHVFNPSLSESVDATEPDTLTISSPRDVLASHGIPKFLATLSAIQDAVSMRLPALPFSLDCRQLASLCLAPLWISCAGFPQSRVLQFLRAVTLLGGHFTRGFSDSVTLLIAATNLSRKVLEARRRHLPVVTERWLDACAAELKRTSITSFLLPPFAGLTISSSDLTPRVHKKWRQTVTSGGGVWSDNFDDSVTFLVADALAQTKKVSLALANSVPIIRASSDPTAMDFLNWWVISSRQSDLFQSVVFSMHRRLENIEVLQEAILANSGRIDHVPTHVVLPHGTSNPFESAIAVTPNWLWACVDAQRLLPTDHSILFTPLGHRGQIASAIGVRFLLYAVDGDAKSSLADMVRFAGGSVVYRMVEGVKYVVASEANPELIKIAIEMRVPVVNQGFVVEMVKKGEVPDAAAFRLEGIKQESMLRKLCGMLTRLNVARDRADEGSAVERRELENFTQDAEDFRAHEIRVKYGGQGAGCAPQGSCLDTLLTIMDGNA
jgi:hypothetical protein